MRPRRFLSIVAILFLLVPMTCPLMAAAQTEKTEHSGHDCAGTTGKQQKQENSGMHVCCDQQAIQAKAIELKQWNSDEMLTPMTSESIAGMSIVVQALQDFAHLRFKTGDLLAKLSVLRI